jgi:hypothetical protein
MRNSTGRIRAFFLACALLLSFVATWPIAASAQDLPDEASLQKIREDTAGQTPIFGPESGELALDFSEASIWAAAVSERDVRVHLEILPPVLETRWNLFISIRGTRDPQTFLDVSTDSSTDNNTVWVYSDGNWKMGGLGDRVDSLVMSVDVIGQGDVGYLGINGTYVATLDLTNAIGPGDVVLGASQQATGDPALRIASFTVWDIGSDIPAVESSDATETPASDDAALFDQLRTDAAIQPIVFGPEDGSLPHDPQAISYVDAEVSVSDFAARVDCLAPVAQSEGKWDCGLEFGDLSSNNHYRLVVVSDGTWVLTIGSDPPSQSGEGIPPVVVAGDKLAIDLIVTGGTGYFGVNDAYIATLDLSAIPGPGTVAVASSFYAETTIEGAETAYQDFTVWSFDEATTEPGVETPATPEAGTATGDDAAAFQQMVASSSGQTPVFGPESQELPFEAFKDCPECTWAAGLSLTDLHAHLELEWPGDGSLPVNLFIAIRQTDPSQLNLFDPNFISISPTGWLVGDSAGT